MNFNKNINDNTTATNIINIHFEKDILLVRTVHEQYQLYYFFIIYMMCLNFYYRLWGLVVGTKAVTFCIGTLVRKHTASYKQYTTTSRVELSHFCCLLYVVSLVSAFLQKTKTYKIGLGVCM